MPDWKLFSRIVAISATGLGLDTSCFESITHQERNQLIIRARLNLLRREISLKGKPE
jgi:hypothetical protein